MFFGFKRGGYIESKAEHEFMSRTMLPGEFVIATHNGGHMTLRRTNMTTDLTKITTPFGLLDEETQKRLLEHRGELEVYVDGKWYIKRYNTHHTHFTYRAKHTPIERWVNVYVEGKQIGHTTRELADKNAGPDRVRCVRLVEVSE